MSTPPTVLTVKNHAGQVTSFSVWGTGDPVRDTLEQRIRRGELELLPDPAPRRPRRQAVAEEPPPDLGEELPTQPKDAA